MGRAKEEENRLTTKPLTRAQIGYAKERCIRIAGRKRGEINTAADAERLPDLTDYDKLMLMKSGDVEVDLHRIKSERSDRQYYAPRIVDVGDFSIHEKRIKAHNKEVEKRKAKAIQAIDRRAESIIDRFELGEPEEALDLLTKFEAEEFAL